MHQPVKPRKFHRAAAAIIGVAVIATMMVACGNDDEADSPDAPTIDNDEAQLPDGVEPFDLPALDLDTLEAEIPDGTLVAEPWDSAWVGEVTDDLFIGIRVDGDEVVAYLCDDDIQIILNGTLTDGEATLSDDGDQVAMAFEGDLIAGEVALEGAEPETFTAERATGEAGVYAAQHALADVEVTARWVVLDDGRQRGRAICCFQTPEGRRVCINCPHPR